MGHRSVFVNMALRMVLMMIFFYSSDVHAVQFIFTPSPNIEVSQQAHYQCSVNDTGVTISWFVNGIASENNDIIQLGIVTNGAGSSNSSLTIPGNPQYNNSVVRCVASGFVNDDNYFNSNDSTLRIQGKLSEVGNLTCTRQGHCCINCSWSPPFSLEGVPIYGYIINVTNEGDNTQYTTTSNTTSWIYCPSKFGNYAISIAGNNSAGEGKTIVKAITLPTVTISEYSVTAEKVNKNLTTIFTIKNETFLDNPSYVLVHLTPISDDTSPVDGQGSGQFEGDTFIGTVNMGDLPDKKKWLISFSLVYNSGLYINVSQPTVFTTFDVQNGSLEVMDTTTGEVCFTCYFVTGSQSQGCFVKYESHKADFNGNTTIAKRSADRNATKCVTGIHSSTYNVTFYDVDHNNTIYEDKYAIKLTYQSVTGLSFSTSTLTVPSTSSDSDNSSTIIPAMTQDLWVKIGGVVTAVMLILEMAMIIVVVILILWKHQPAQDELPINKESLQVIVNNISPVSDKVIEE